jgi:hypothetical protein
LGAGADYYNEAMSCDWRTERRVECFRAAEVLYLHASRLGNAMADDDLTYVYSYDRCEGNYGTPWLRVPSSQGRRNG